MDVAFSNPAAIPTPQINLVLNWLEDVKRRVPAR